MMRTTNIPLTIIGGGTMGKSFALMLTERGFVDAEKLTVSDRDPSSIKDLAREHNIHITGSNPQAAKNARVILLAVKPIDIPVVTNEIKSIINGSTLIISIVAGLKIHSLQRTFGQSISIVRAMPNTPARIAKGITVWTSNRRVSIEQKTYVKSLFSTLGEQYYTERESLLDKVTAISGSGPAYYFYFTEALIHAALKLGLSESLAYALATKTFFGTATLMEQTGKTPEELREAVTSKKGTTEAAIRALDKGKFGEIVTKGVRAAFIRAQQLGNGN